MIHLSFRFAQFAFFTPFPGSFVWEQNRLFAGTKRVNSKYTIGTWRKVAPMSDRECRVAPLTSSIAGPMKLEGQQQPENKTPEPSPGKTERSMALPKSIKDREWIMPSPLPGRLMSNQLSGFRSMCKIEAACIARQNRIIWGDDATQQRAHHITRQDKTSHNMPKMLSLSTTMRLLQRGRVAGGTADSNRRAPTAASAPKSPRRAQTKPDGVSPGSRSALPRAPASPWRASRRRRRHHAAYRTSAGAWPSRNRCGTRPGTMVSRPRHRTAQVEPARSNGGGGGDGGDGASPFE